MHYIVIFAVMLLVVYGQTCHLKSITLYYCTAVKSFWNDQSLHCAWRTMASLLAPES